MKRSRSQLRIPTRSELDLWSRVVKDVEPLRGVRSPAAPAEPEASESRRAEPEAEPKSPAPPPIQPPSRSPPSLAPLEARFRRRLARGVVAIDARIDLHGLRQEEAHRRLVAFLSGAQARGHKLVLVITGKGGPVRLERDPYAERGVLRRSVPIWLSSPAARNVVVGFEPADPVHGGAGALYVRIRKGGRL
jgi:DNA-nicking Smr family endonuclease